MKSISIFVSVTFLSWFLLSSTTAATLVGLGDASAIPGVDSFDYDTYVVLDSDQMAVWTSDTDAYSWDHPNLANDNPQLGNQTGWTHLTRWVAVTLSEPVDLTIRIDRAAGVQIPDQNNPGAMIGAGNDLIPAFTMWRGFEAEAEDGSLGLANPNGGHRWDNDGDETVWMDNLVYLAHDGNTSNADFVEWTMPLQAGDYTVNIAGSKDGAFDPGIVAGDLRKGFTATLTAAPVPEPSTGLLVAGALVWLVAGRRRPRR